jgi:rhodanese-related sulfurtransferase
VRKELIVDAPAYQLSGVREVVDLVNSSPGLVIADMRPKDEFQNKSKDAFYNLGHIKNAVNFTDGSQLEDYLKGKPKNTPVLIYGTFSAADAAQQNNPMRDIDVAPICKKLAADGYSNVHLLFGGLFWMVWASSNVDGQQDARSILTDHEGLF